MSLDGTRVAVGSPSADDDAIGANVGRVRVYERVGGAGDWTQVGADLTLGDVGFMSDFGAAVWLSNDGKIVVVGAPRYGDGDAGLVRAYEETNGDWAQIGQDLTGGDVADDVIWYGRKLTMSSNSSMTGSPSRELDVGGQDGRRPNVPPSTRTNNRVDGTRRRRAAHGRRRR